MTSHAFTQELIAEVPSIGPLVSEHLADADGELLIHLLMADLLRFTVREFHEGDRDISKSCLSVVDRALRFGDDALTNAVAVSFVENAGLEDGETPEFIATWPQNLRQELASQQSK